MKKYFSLLLAVSLAAVGSASALKNPFAGAGAKVRESASKFGSSAKGYAADTWGYAKSHPLKAAGHTFGAGAETAGYAAMADAMIRGEDSFVGRGLNKLMENEWIASHGGDRFMELMDNNPWFRKMVRYAGPVAAMAAMNMVGARVRGHNSAPGRGLKAAASMRPNFLRKKLVLVAGTPGYNEAAKVLGVTDSSDVTVYSGTTAYNAAMTVIDPE